MNKKTIVGIITAIAVIGVAIGLGVYFTSDAYKHPDCLLFRLEGKEQLGNGVCDYAANSNPMRDFNPNTEACEWDMGDCLEWNEKYKDCVPGTHPSELYKRSWIDRSGLGVGSCKKEYNREECGFDVGLCTEFNEKYPACEAIDPSRVGDGKCDNAVIGMYTWDTEVTDKGTFNTEECQYDGGDCDDFNAKYPNCVVPEPFRIGDGECGGDIDFNAKYLMTEECGYDGGDCDELMNKYPDCPINFLPSLGNGYCDWEDYVNPNIEECGYDGGDCAEFNEVLAKYPACTCSKEDLLLDETCNSGSMNRDKSESCNVEECGFDNGACIDFNEAYPNCDKCSPFLNDDISDTTICMTEDIEGDRSGNPCPDVENCGTGDDGCYQE